MKNLVDFFLNKGKKPNNKNELSPLKVGLGIGVVVLLLTTVFFSDQISTLLDFIGIRAANPDGVITVTVTDVQDGDSEADVWPEDVPPANIAEFNIEFNPDQTWWDPNFPLVPGVVEVIINDVVVIPPLEDNYHISPGDVTFSQDLRIDPLIFNIDDPGPKSITMRVVTSGVVIGLNEYVDFMIEPMGTFEFIPCPVLCTGNIAGLFNMSRINFHQGAAPGQPDFSLVLEEPRIVTVEGGQIANYQITVTSIDGFEGLVDLFSPELMQYWLTDGYLTGVDVSENPVDFTGLPDQSKVIDLTIYTDNDPGHPYDLNLDFDVIGSSTGLPDKRDSGTVIVVAPPPLGDFEITVSWDPTSPNPLENGNPPSIVRVVPNGWTRFNVNVRRLNGYTEIISATHDLLTGWPTDISSAIWEFEDPIDPTIGHFIYSPSDPDGDTMTLTVNIDPDAIYKDVDFTVTGVGIIDGIPVPHTDVPSDGSLFKITDYSMTIGVHDPDTDPDIQTAPADIGTVTYRVFGTSYNSFIENDLRFKIVSLGALDILDFNGGHITDLDAIIPVRISPGQLDFFADVTFHVDRNSPGTNSGDLIFAVEATGTETGLVHMSTNNGILNITTQQDFSIEVTRSLLSPDPIDPDYPNQIKTFPTGQVIFDVTLTRFNNLRTDVNVTHNLLTNWPGDISSAVFANGGLFDKQNQMIETTTLTVNILPTAQVKKIDFEVTGIGDIAGVPETRYDFPPEQSVFYITDYRITITDPAVQTVPADIGMPVIYNVLVESLGGFRDDNITLRLLPDGFVANNPTHLIGGGLLPSNVSITADSPTASFLLPFNVNPNSPGTDPTGLVFSVESTSTSTGLVEESNSGTLHITTVQDFTITVAMVSSDIYDPDHPNRTLTIPSGQVVYNVAVVRYNGYAGQVEVSHDLLDPNNGWEDDVASATFANNGQFYDGTPMEVTTLTVNILPGPQVQFVNFVVSGVGIGIPETKTDFPPNSSSFYITDYTITILEPTTQDVPAYIDEVYYKVRVESLGGFRDDNMTFQILPTNFLINNLQHITSIDLPLGPLPVSADITILEFDIVLHVNPNSPGTLPGAGLVFTVEGNGDVGLVKESNPGTLNITTQQDFSITLGSPTSTSDVADTAVPGGSITYDVKLLRFYGFDKPVTLGSDLGATSWRNEIASFDFTGGADFNDATDVFQYQGSATQTATLTIIIGGAAAGVDIDFMVWGDGDVDNNGTIEIPSERRFALGSFSIVDFIITVEDTPQTVNAHEQNLIDYTITAHRVNDYTGWISLTIDVLPYHSDVIEAAWFDHPILDATQAVPEIQTTLHIRTVFDPSAKYVPFTVTGIDLDKTDIYLNPLTNSGDGELFIVDTEDFSISIAPDYQFVGPGGSTSYTVSATRYFGFTGPIDLTETLSGQQYIISAVFVDSTLTIGNDSTILNVTVDDFAPDVSILFDVIGTGTPGTRTDNATLEIINPLIVDFFITVNPEEQDTGPGGNVSYSVVATRINGFNGAITLSTNLDSFPYINSAVFADDVLNAGETTTTLNVIVDDPALNSTITFIVEGSGTPGIRSDSAILNIINPSDFTVAISPNERTVEPGGNTSYTVTVTGLFNYSGTIDLTTTLNTNIAGIADVNFDNDSLVITPANPVQTTNLNVTAEDPTADATIPFDVFGRDIVTLVVREDSALLFIVNDPDFAIAVEPAERTVEPGEGTTYLVTVTALNNFTGTVDLSTNLESFPEIGSVIFDDLTLTFTAGVTELSTTMNVMTVNPADDTSIDFLVFGSGAPGIRSATATLHIVNPLIPDFSILVIPDERTVEPGGNTSYTIVVTRINGHTEIIVLSTNLQTDNPNEIRQVTFIADGSGGPARLTVITTEVRNSLTPITFTVFGTTDTAVRSDDADLIIYKAPDDPITPPPGGGPTKNFTIAIVPDMQTVLAGNSTTYTIELRRFNGFSGAVTITANLLNNPEVLSAAFANDGTFPAQSGDQETIFSVNTSPTADPIDVVFIVSGVGSVGTRSDNAILRITVEDEEVVVVTPTTEEELPSTGPEDYIWLVVLLILIATSWGYALEPNPKENK